MIISILKWMALVPVDLLTTVLGRFIAPFAVPFASKDGWFPWWLKWLGTYDNSLEGDNGWKTEHWQWRYKLPDWLARYVGRVGFLWRNNMYGFDIDVLGAPIQEGFKFQVWGNPEVSNLPLVEGWVFRKLTNPDGTVYWQFYWVKSWCAHRAVRVVLGWKLWGTLVAGEKRQYVFSPRVLVPC